MRRRSGGYEADPTPVTAEELVSRIPGAAFTPLSSLMPPEARECVLAVSLMLKNRYDAADVSEGSHVQQVIDGYDRVRRLRAILGSVTEAEIEAATALWEETAS